MKSLSALLKHCASIGCTFVCYYDDPGDVDYKGTSQRAAKKALEACDVMNLIVLDKDGKRWGWAHIITERGQDPEEQIADHTCNDGIDAWMQEGEPE
jgi:hypothetical protein